MRLVSVSAIERVVRYLNYLKKLEGAENDFVSSTAIAEALSLNAVQVRKDLASVSSGGKPKVGYTRADLIREIEAFLSTGRLSYAVLVGAGNLGKALLSYGGFERYGLSIKAAFDCDEKLIGQEINGKKIYNTIGIGTILPWLDNIKIGILTVPSAAAQEACDRLVAAGIKAVWNFTSKNLNVPKGVTVKNENLAASFVILNKQLDNLLK